MMQTKWFHNWSEFVPGTTTQRVTVLRQMKNISEEAEEVPPSYDQCVAWIRTLAATGALNRSQIGALIGWSRQRVQHAIADGKIAFNDEHTVRGVVDRRSILPMLEIATRLAGQDSIPVYLLLAAQTNTDKSLIQHLTGIPIHVLRRVRSAVETELGVRLSSN